jgi:hypothetical protein
VITTFAVGAELKLIDQFSPALRKLLGEIRKLNEGLDQARASLAAIGRGVGLGAAVTETEGLATAWGNVAKNAVAAQRAIGGASATAARTGAAAAAIGGGGGGGGRQGFASRFLPNRGGGGAHVGGPSIPIPGGGHVRGRGGAMAGAGLLGYGVYEAAQMEDAVFQLIYHSGLEQNDATRSKFRKMLQDSMVESGYGLKDIAEAAKQEIRMFQGTPGGGLDVLPEMLRAATIEARLKGEGPKESMRALIGLAHMTKQYSPEAIKKLAPAFAFLSTANPASLGSIERAAGYAVPILQSSLEVDPVQALLMGTALTRAGATNTKSGTWLREMAIRAMPGTSLVSAMAARKHNAGLKALGLLDENEKPTWFTDGKPDLFKMMDIARERADAMPLTQRAGVERQVFGAQGAGAFALLSDPAVKGQIAALREQMNSPEFKNRYSGFMEQYTQGSTVQQARTSLQEFNILMMDLGKTVLPAVNGVLRDFKGILEGIRGLIPGSDANKWKIGTRGIEGAGIGAAIGFVTPVPGGAAIGAATGAIIGGGLGALETEQMKGWKGPGSPAWKAPNLSLQPPAAPKLPPITLQLNIDGRTLAQAVSEELGQLHEHATGAPAANGLSNFGRADGGISTD